jgi:AraC-like DNA-binding protein
MEFSLHEPPPQLADSVKTIWCARGTRREFETPDPIVPDGCVEIIFNLGDPFIDADAGDPQPRDLIAGQMTRPVVAVPTGDVDLIGVRFKTGRAGAALRVPMWQLQDRLIAASAVMTGVDALAQDLRQVSGEQWLNHLTRSLHARLAPIDVNSLTAVDHALTIIDAARGNVSIERVATRVGVTRRHLERQFRDHVGLGVKQLARIARVHSVLDLLQQQPAMSGAEIAVACGYSDQAHMIRECQQLAGRTPRRLKTTARSLSALIRGGSGADRIPA